MTAIGAVPANTDTTAAGLMFEVGDIVMYGGDPAAPPTGFIAASGTAVSRIGYSALHALYSAAGYPYGAGDGSTTFGIPSLNQSRFPMGRAAAGTSSVIGATGGALSHTHGAGSIAGGAHGHSTGNMGAGHSHTRGALSGFDHTHPVHQYASHGKNANDNTIPLNAECDPTGQPVVTGDSVSVGVTSPSILGVSGTTGPAVTGSLNGGADPAYQTVAYLIKI